jgi:hypothetical protein
MAVKIMAAGSKGFLKTASMLLASLFLVQGPVQSFQPIQSTPLVPDELTVVDNSVAVLRALDKITARITQLEVPVGDETEFGTLRIKVEYCRTRSPIETPETFAFLEIDDVKRTGGRSRVFSGWMVASSPGLNGLEHAVYDVWVINCKATDPQGSGESR